MKTLLIVLFLLPIFVKADTESIKNLIHIYSVKYDVSEIAMNKIVSCESGYNPDIVGDHGFSFGLVQIYRPAHPEITKNQALNPDFALDFLAKNMKEGRAYWWTCAKMFGLAVNYVK